MFSAGWSRVQLRVQHCEGRCWEGCWGGGFGAVQAASAELLAEHHPGAWAAPFAMEGQGDGPWVVAGVSWSTSVPSVS